MRTRVRIDRHLIYGGQWIDLGPLFTSVATSLLSRVILPLPSTRPTFPATILSNRNFSQSYGKPSTGVEIVSPVIIHLREHALISSLLFQFSSEWKKNVAIIVPSPSPLPALLFPSRFLSKKRRNTDTKVIASSFEPIDRGNNESSMLGRFFTGSWGKGG